MTDFVASISSDDVIDALVVFLQPFSGGNPIVRSEINRVAMPASPCIVLSEVLQTDLTIPHLDYQPGINTATIHGPARIDVQIDFYGDRIGVVAAAVKSAYRTEWAFTQFPENIRPLYTSDLIQAPLTTGEAQYESRWTMTIAIQYNPDITVPQEFADVATVKDTIPADLQ